MHLTTVMTEAAVISGVDCLIPQLYSFRHGGASFDAISRRRPMADIKKRGRWRSDASIRRYSKAAVALREASRLPKQAMEYAQTVEAALQHFMLGRISPPAPPWAKQRADA